MDLERRDMIVYDGLQEVYSGEILDYKKVCKPISIGKSKKIINKVEFKSNLLMLNKFLEYDDRDIFIFHSCIEVEIFYFCEESNEIEISKEEFYDSYLVHITPKDFRRDNLYGRVVVVDGYIENFNDDMLYIFFKIALVLGGTS